MTYRNRYCERGLSAHMKQPKPWNGLILTAPTAEAIKSAYEKYAESNTNGISEFVDDLGMGHGYVYHLESMKGKDAPRVTLCISRNIQMSPSVHRIGGICDMTITYMDLDDSIGHLSVEAEGITAKIYIVGDDSGKPRRKLWTK